MKIFIHCAAFTPLLIMLSTRLDGMHTSPLTAGT